jgi:hypothetical protein
VIFDIFIYSVTVLCYKIEGFTFHLLELAMLLQGKCPKCRVKSLYYHIGREYICILCDHAIPDDKLPGNLQAELLLHNMRMQSMPPGSDTDPEIEAQQIKKFLLGGKRMKKVNQKSSGLRPGAKPPAKGK